MPKTALISLVLIGGGLLTAIATGGYFLASGLNGKQRAIQRKKRELELSPVEGRIKNEDEGLEWEMIFKSTTNDGVICQAKKNEESEKKEPQMECDTIWLKAETEAVKKEDLLRVRIKKELVGEIGDSLVNGKCDAEKLGDKLKEKLGQKGGNIKGEIGDRKTCSKEEQENRYIFTWRK